MQTDVLKWSSWMGVVLLGSGFLGSMLASSRGAPTVLPTIDEDHLFERRNQGRDCAFDDSDFPDWSQEVKSRWEGRDKGGLEIFCFEDFEVFGFFGSL